MTVEGVTSANAAPSTGKHVPLEQYEGGRAHLVQFYDDDHVLAEAVSRFIVEGVAAGEGLIVIATDEHWSAIDRLLAQAGVASASLVANSQLHVLSAKRLLDELIVGSELSRERFQATVAVLVSTLLESRAGRVRAYGEMVDVLWKEGRRGLAIQLEELWNDLQARSPFTLLCAYAAAGFYREPAAGRHVCSVHTHVYGLHDGVPVVRQLAPASADGEERPRRARAGSARRAARATDRAAGS